MGSQYTDDEDENADSSQGEQPEEDDSSDSDESSGTDTAPNESTDSSDDSSGAVDRSQVADYVEKNRATPAAAANSAVAPAIDDKTKAIQDYVASQYAKANDDSGVKEAQDEARWKNNVANFGSAFESLARSNSMAHGGAGVDENFYKGLQQQGQQGIATAQANRQAAVQNFLQQNEIKRQVAEDMMKRGTYENQQQVFQWQKNRQDPTSQDSKNAQDAFKSLWGKQLGDMDVSHLSATQIDDLSKQYEVKAKVDEAKAAADLKAQVSRDNAALRGQIASEAAASREDARQAKTDRQNSNNYADLIKQAEGGRGAPKKVIAAQMSGTAIDNALELIHQYPNPNDMPESQVHLLIGELEKVATNGSGTDAGRQGLDPNTFEQALQKFKSRAGNKPTGAQLGAFIQMNSKYLGGLKNISDGIINGYRRNLFAGNKDRISPDQANDYQGRYSSAFPETNQQTASGGTKSPYVDTSGTAIAAPAGPSKDDLEAEMKRRGLLK